jgi:dihydrofolate reductase
MKVSIIVAYSDHRVIGGNNKLLWHLSDDLKNFKRLTMGHFIIMGRKTWDSLGKPLPGRTHLVISRNKDFSPAGAEVFHSFEDALRYAAGKGQEEVFIIGGEQIYRLAFPHADKLYITVVQSSFEGDAYFPEIKADQWELISRKMHPEDEKHPYAFEMLELTRRNP